MKKTVCLILAMIMLVPFFRIAAAEDAGILGKPFPDFSATDTEGNVFTLSEALKDHEAVLINIWTTWCPPCEAEFPYLNEVYKQYGDRVAFIALSGEVNDTLEKIEAYRQAHGIAFPMGRDEGTKLFSYMMSNGFPTTVVVDRFGRAAFMQIGSFTGAKAVTRVLEYVISDSYTETDVLTAVPPDSSTCAFPVSQTRAILVDNENVRAVTFRSRDIPETQPVYVVYDDTVHVRLQPAASDNIATMLCIDLMKNEYFELADLLDTERGAFVYDAAMPAAQDPEHYACICMADIYESTMSGIYVVPGDEYIEELAEEMRSWGYEVSWEYEDNAAVQDVQPQAYILHMKDQKGAPVPGVYVNFCTDTTCTMAISDESGTISFDGAPDTYHVQLLKVPEGYSFDADFELYTDSVYGEWIVRVRAD